MVRPLNFRQLEAFRAVMLTGSMTGAGQLMCISQPAVSRLVRALEDDVGLTLFERQGAQLTPTEEGRCLYQEVARHFDSTERIREAARAIRESTAGHLRIGAMPNLAARCLPEAVSRFLSSYPDVDVSVHSDSSVNLVQMLLNGHFDVAYAAPPSGLEGFEHDPFFDVRAVCAMPAGHPLNSRPLVAVADLDGVDFIELGINSSQRMQVNAAILSAGVQPRRRVETVHSSSVMEYVARAVGVAVIDPIALLGLPPAPVSFRPFAADIIMPIRALYRPGVARGRLARAFTPLFQDVVAAQLADFQARTGCSPYADERRRDG